MGKNQKYILQNLDIVIPTCFWTMYIENFFGKEKAEEFYEYLISAHDIKRKNDIRNMFSCIGFSIYNLSKDEQLAFISIFRPFDTESKLVSKMENGVNSVFEYYSKRNMQLIKDIKELGYSCEYAKFNWKDKKLKDTYQREYVLIIFSEDDTPEQFKEKIIKIAKKYNNQEVLITDRMKEKSTRMQLKSSIIDVCTGKETQAIEDTTIDTIEIYLSDISKTKVVYKIPYENNKKVMNKDVNYLKMKEYYSRQKQEKVKNRRPYSFNSAMIRKSLLDRFEEKNYNN